MWCKINTVATEIAEQRETKGIWLAAFSAGLKSELSEGGDEWEGRLTWKAVRREYFLAYGIMNESGGSSINKHPSIELSFSPVCEAPSSIHRRCVWT